MKKKILLALTVATAVTFTTGGIAAFSGNKFAGMTKQQKLEKKDASWNKVEQLQTELKELNRQLYGTEDFKNKVPEDKINSETLQLLNKISQKNDEIKKYQKETYEISQDEDVKDYKTQLERALETLKAVQEDEKVLLENASTTRKTIYIELNSRRKELYSKYAAKLKEKNVNYKELYDSYSQERDAMMKEFRTEMGKTQ